MCSFGAPNQLVLVKYCFPCSVFLSNRFFYGIFHSKHTTQNNYLQGIVSGCVVPLVSDSAPLFFTFINILFMEVSECGNMVYRMRLTAVSF